MPETPRYRQTFFRLLGFLRPYKVSLAISTVFAIGYQASQIALVWLTKNVIDDALAPHDPRKLWFYVGGIVVLGLVRALLMYGRRMISGRQALAVEMDLRQGLYSHLVRLSFGFYDRHQTGQLMSRATVDLQGVRFFLGYGLIFFFQNILTVASVSIVLFFFEWRLALVVLGVTPFLIALAYRYSRVAHPTLRDVADLVEPKELPAGEGAIRFEDVSFSYLPDRPVLENLDLALDAGTTVALIGHTGAGKTTLASLVPRFYDVDSGRVLVDGVDVRDVKLASLRSSIGAITQDPFLFSTTVRENIAFGRPELSDEDVERVARLAQANEFVERLPQGYETVIGERGITLSGGQRQRVAIARALAVDPRILILDDATASVDATTEARIRAGLREVMRGRTTLIIAHRLSTIALADEIVVLDSGRIACRGTHDELLETSAVYREIYEHGLLERQFADAVEARGDVEEVA